MNCFHCNTKLTWGGDHDCEDNPDHSTVTNLSCPCCGSFVLFYLAKEKKEDDS